MPKHAEESIAPLCGADLERWRLGQGLSKSEAANAFGLQTSKWEELVARDCSATPIADPVIAMLLQLYISDPAAAPTAPPPDIRAFYGFLGLRDCPADKEVFATLIGRSQASVYRLLDHDGKPGRPLIKWMEAVRRLRLDPQASRTLMEKVAATVSERQDGGASAMVRNQQDKGGHG